MKYKRHEKRNNRLNFIQKYNLVWGYGYEKTDFFVLKKITNNVFRKIYELV